MILGAEALGEARSLPRTPYREQTVQARVGLTQCCWGIVVAPCVGGALH